MSCNDCGGVFFRQLDTQVVSLTDTVLTVVPFEASMIPYSWWKVGRRLVFDVPVKGILYSDTVFGVRLRDNTSDTSYELGSFEVQAGSEIESFRLVCDVVDIDNSEVTLKCWIDYGFPIGLEVPANPFFEAVVDNHFRPLAVQVFATQGAEVETELTFQNAQFSGLPKAADLVC